MQDKGVHSEKRIRRIKIRLTDKELEDLRGIAADHSLSMAAVLRNGTLDRDWNQLIIIDLQDLHELTGRVSEMDNMARELLRLAASRTKILYREGAARLLTTLHEVNSAYDDLYNTIILFRKRIAERCEALCKQRECRNVSFYFERIGGPRRMLSISVNETEWRLLHEAADLHDCSISCLVKRNAIDFFGGGRIVVSSNPLDSLVLFCKREMRFMSAVIAEVRSRFPNEGDLLSATEILENSLNMIREEKERVCLNSEYVWEEADNLLKGWRG